jgi:hypothetical protein
MMEILPESYFHSLKISVFKPQNLEEVGIWLDTFEKSLMDVAIPETLWVSNGIKFLEKIPEIAVCMAEMVKLKITRWVKFKKYLMEKLCGMRSWPI